MKSFQRVFVYDVLFCSLVFVLQLKKSGDSHQAIPYLTTYLLCLGPWADVSKFHFLTLPPSIVTYHIIVANAIVDTHLILVFDGSATSVLYEPGFGIEMQT